MKDYIVFFDIDGVLTNHRVQMSHASNDIMWNRFDPVAIDLFNKIFIESGGNVSFVCVSSWKNTFSGSNSAISLVWQSMLRNAGLIGDIPYPLWLTSENGIQEVNYKSRAKEIFDYIKRNNLKVKDFIVFDDSDIGYSSIEGSFIKTCSENGILFSHIVKALDITKDWK